MDHMSNINHSMFCAIREGRVEEVRKFVKFYGLSYLNVWLEGYSLLCDSITYRYTEITKLLLTSGCKVNKEDEAACDTALHLAARNGDIVIVSMLLDRGVQINSKNEDGSTPLHEAIKCGKINVTVLLLKHNADVNVIDNDGLSPLLVSVTHNHLEIVKLILDHGGNVNDQDKDGKTVLYLAIEQGNLKIIQQILKYRPDINNNNNNNNYLKAALYKGGKYCYNIVESLLQYGFFVNPEDMNDSRILCSAVRNRCLQIVEVLLQHGIDINAKDEIKNTAIFYAIENSDLILTKQLLANGADIKGNPKLLNSAVRKKCTEIVNLLLQHGANINAKNKTKNTALFYAIDNGDLILTKLLLTNGADVKSSPKLLNTAVRKKHREIVEALLQYGADVNAKDNREKSAIFYAILNADVILTRLLLSNGADVKDSAELLSTAVKGGCIDIVEKLLRHGIDINAKDEIENTAIFYAIENSDLILTKLLLANGADIKGNPKLLNSAVRKKCREIVDLLLQHGANINAKDSKGKTAIFYAIEKANVILTKLFLNNGADIKGSPDLLNTAVQNKCREIVEELLLYGADVNAKDNAGKTAISCAIENLDVILTKLLLTNGADIKGSPELLHSAVKNQCREIIEILLQHGADINVKDNKGQTPIFYANEKADLILTKLFLTNGANLKDNPELLHTAVKKKRKDIVDALLQFGADVNAKDYKKKTVLFYAIERVDLILTKKLLANGADIKDNPEFLNSAVKKRCRELVETLIQHGADINGVDNDGKTALLCAIEKTDLILTKLLLSNGANIKDNPRLLHTAVRKRCREIVETLLQQGADINAKDNCKRTAISYAIENTDLILTKLLLTNGADIKDIPELLSVAVKKKNGEIIELLLQHGANINAKDKKGKTAILYAIESADVVNTKLLLTNGANIKGVPKLLNIAVKLRCRELVEILLQHGADINARDEGGVTALHSCISVFHDMEDYGINGPLEVTKLLLSQGANIHAKKPNGETPLHIAVLNYHKEIVELLLKYGSKIMATNRNGVTPLHFAAIKGSTEIVRILLKFGADIDAINECGKTALHIACEEKYPRLVTMLLEYGSDINIVCKSGWTPIGLVDSRGHFSADDFRSDPDGRTIMCCLVEHILKMKIANLYVNKKNLSFLNKVNNSSLKSSCEKEIEVMKSEKISNSNVSFYDFLTKNVYQLATYARNENIVQVLKLESYKRKFTLYASMINSSFKKAMKRKELLEQVNKHFHSLFNMLPELPSNCTEIIFSYLTNKDLQLLLDVSE